MSQAFRIRDVLDAAAGDELRVPPELLERYTGAFDLVDADDPHAVCACFTAAYGRSLVRSGSYLFTGRTGQLQHAGIVRASADACDSKRVRRFSPREILRMLGFPARFSLPPDWAAWQAWPEGPTVRLAHSTVDIVMPITLNPDLGLLYSPSPRGLGHATVPIAHLAAHGLQHETTADIPPRRVARRGNVQNAGASCQRMRLSSRESRWLG
jgi:hypothetical protein